MCNIHEHTGKCRKGWKKGLEEKFTQKYYNLSLVAKPWCKIPCVVHAHKARKNMTIKSEQENTDSI